MTEVALRSVRIDDVATPTEQSEWLAPEDLRALNVDPLVETRWLLDGRHSATASLRRMSEEQLQRRFTGDRLMDNLLLNKWEFAVGRTRLKSYPWRLSVPFVLCNAQCEFCAAWLMKGFVPLDDLLTTLLPVVQHAMEIDLVGWGEPLIHPQFAEIIEMLRREADPRARLALTTNGVKLAEWVDRLLEANIMEYAVSLHATNPATHQDLMGFGPHDHARVLEGVRALIARKADYPKLRVELVMVVTRQNIAEIPDFIRLAEDLGVDSVHLRTLMPQHEPREGLDYHRLPPYRHPDFEALKAAAIAAIGRSDLRIQANPDTWSRPLFSPEWEPKLDTLPLTPRNKRKSYRAYVIRWDELTEGERCAVSEPFEALENPYEREAPLFCPSPYTAFYVNGTDRRVIPCVYMHKVQGHEYMHFKPKMTFDEIWNSEPMQKVRYHLHHGPLLPDCLKCPFHC